MQEKQKLEPLPGCDICVKRETLKTITLQKTNIAMEIHLFQ